MIKKPVLLIITALSICSLTTFSQFKTIAESTTFEEPEKGVSRIIQMKNGNTFYIHITEKEGIDLRIYNPSHIQTTVTSIPSSSGRLKAGEFQGAFEVRNNIVLFVSELQDKEPILYRYIFDGTSGKLIEDKQIASVKKFGGLTDVFSVRQAKEGESYAAMIYHMAEDDKDKRTEIIQFGDDHTEKKRTFLVTNDNDDFKFFVYMNMEVLDDNRVAVILYNGKEKYFYNTKKGRMVMALIDSKKTDVTYTVIDFPEKIKFAECATKYVPKTKKLYLLVREMNEKDRNNYDNYLVKINTETNKTETNLVIDLDENLNKKYKEKFSLKDDYVAAYRNFYVNEDESYSIIYEERFSVSGTYGSNSQFSGSSYYSGKIMVMNYNSKGEVVSGYVVPKSYNEDKFSQYKAPLYVVRGNNRYMMINDTERNNDVKKDKFVTIVGVSDCDAFIYNLSGDDIVPKRDYFFGAGGETGHNLASFKVSDYDATKGMLVIMKLNKKSSDNKAVSMVWMQLL